MDIEWVIKSCEALKLTTIAKRIVEFSKSVDDWEEKHERYLCYLYNLLEFEYAHRQSIKGLRLLKEARFPLLKGLESFNFEQSPHLPEKKIRDLAEGSYIPDARPIIFLGESGTGKTHLATAIGYRNTELGYKVRFVSASQLANELIAAHAINNLLKVVDYYNSFAVLVIDELGFLPLSKMDAELMFQVLSKRHEQKPIVITTNLPFSEWINVFPDPRLCRAIVDRVTHRAHIIETGDRSARLAQTLSGMQKQ